MREKAEARKSKQADSALGRKMTIAKKIREEEKRIETGSQVAGAQLTTEQ